ncbi:hypothetical protein GCM10010232_01400 [Streptomyces amakusaensis]
MRRASSLMVRSLGGGETPSGGDAGTVRVDGVAASDRGGPPVSTDAIDGSGVMVHTVGARAICVEPEN